MAMTPRSRAREQSREDGFALLIVLLMTIVIVGVTYSGHSFMQAIRTKSEAGFRLHAQASQFARSGITEALSWFKKQTTQPVLSFAPVLDKSVSPPRNETSDPDIGLVREFRISGDVWGRYEVWKQWDADPDPTRLKFRKKVQLEDISLESGQAVAGIVWRVQCMGTVFRQKDPGKQFNLYPNEVIARELLEAEFHRTLGLTPPGKAAICAHRADNVTIGNRGRVYGMDSAGVFYPELTGSVVTSGTYTLDGAPPKASSSAYAGDPLHVLGVTIDELKQLADIVANSPSELPDSIPPGAVVVIQNSLPVVIDNAHPLKGRGVILFDTPGVLFNQGNLSDFYGLVYFNGPVEIDGPTRLTGSVVAADKIYMHGTGDFANVTYDEVVISDLRKLFSYRISGAIRRSNNL
ncbi:MAG: hypothetical protein R3F30_09820 [Planctomycetota bacterium]